MILLDNKPVEFNPTFDETVTVWLKPLGSVDRAQILDELKSKNYGDAEGLIKYAQRMIVDIDAEGVEFDKNPRGYISDALLNRLPDELIGEIAVRCAEIGGLVEAEKKP